MMKMTSLSIFILLISPLASADDANDVRCREISFSQSVENGDLAAFESFLDADARFVGASINRGPTDIAAAWSVFFSEDGPKIMWRPQFIEVLEDGNLALSRGPFRMTTEDADGIVSEFWGTFNSVWRKQTDDSWKVVFDAGSDAAEPPAEEVQALLEGDDDCR
jgi:ketosteroid isomerase-like protein